jgi:hypothetical protein
MSAMRIPYESHGEETPRWYDGKGVWLYVLAVLVIFLLLVL